MTRTVTAENRMATISPSPPSPPSPPSTPRLRTVPSGSRRTLLDGGWWPRSTDPVAELPGLVLAIDRLHGPITGLVLSAEGWSSHPGRLGVSGRILRLGYFTSQPIDLLTAVCANGDRVDLLVIPPDTETATADAAMVVAATVSNLVHAQRILRTVSTASPTEAESVGGWFCGSGAPVRPAERYRSERLTARRRDAAGRRTTLLCALPAGAGRRPAQRQSRLPRARGVGERLEGRP